ncbi:MAG: FCD domain-containing protein [Rhizobiaceae bacterium]
MSAEHSLAMTGIFLEIPARTSSEKAYRLIREDIITGALEPGLKLKIDMLRERYDLGTGPLREALARLSSDHLVHLTGQRGCVVAAMSVEDALDIGNMRKMLEMQAVESSIENASDEWELGLIATFHRLEQIERRMDQGIHEMAEWEIRNQKFHDALVGACNSKWLLRMRQTMFSQHARYRCLSRVTSVKTRDISLEHRAIFEAAMDRNSQLAKKEIGKHIQRTSDTVVSALMANLSPTN